jgi:hypothetical protein
MKSVFPALFDLTSYHVRTLSFHAPGHAATVACRMGMFASISPSM